MLLFINYAQLVDINLFTYLTIKYMPHIIRIAQLKLSFKNTNKPSSGEKSTIFIYYPKILWVFIIAIKTKIIAHWHTHLIDFINNDEDTKYFSLPYKWNPAWVPHLYYTSFYCFVNFNIFMYKVIECRL